MKLDFNFSGVTLLRDWWKKVKANFETVQNEFNNHREKAELDHPEKSVLQKHIADKAVGQGQIADYSIGATQLAQYSVSSAKIYPQAVQTPHIKNENVTKEKLETNIQNQLDAFQEHIDNPSQEIADGAVTNAKIADGAVNMNNIHHELQAKIRNSKNLLETYAGEVHNNLTLVSSDALFKTFNSRYGTLKGAPSDDTVNAAGFVQYFVLTVPIDTLDRVQFAMNTTSLRCFVRRIEGTTGTPWVEISTI